MIIAIITLLFALMGCGKSNDVIADEQANELLDNFEDHDDAVAHEYINWPTFKSLEEFLAFLETPDKGEDIAELALLEKYYIPTGIPETYKIYEIIATTSNIAIWYLPEETLKSEETAIEAYSRRNSFMFIFTRWGLDNPIEGIMRQFEVTEEDFINGEFLFDDMEEMLFWIADGERLTLYLPRSIFNELETAEIQYDNPTIYCTTEVVYLS